MAGLRCILEFGETTIITQVPEPSTLPPPAPVEVLDQYSDLPLLPRASEDSDALHGAFHEVSHIFMASQMHCMPPARGLHNASNESHRTQPVHLPSVWSLHRLGVQNVVAAQVDVYTPFSALLQHLWALWELVLLAEPLLVLAPSPGHPLHIFILYLHHALLSPFDTWPCWQLCPVEISVVISATWPSLTDGHCLYDVQVMAEHHRHQLLCSAGIIVVISRSTCRHRHRCKCTLCASPDCVD